MWMPMTIQYTSVARPTRPFKVLQLTDTTAIFSREFIENDLVPFAQENPTVVVKAHAAHCKHPFAKGEYCE